MKMNRFSVYAGIKSEDFNLHTIDNVFCSNADNALDYAEEFAYGLYCCNPDLDVLEIMKKYKCTEQEAETKFHFDMVSNVIYHVKEYVENNGVVIEEIEHLPKV